MKASKPDIILGATTGFILGSVSGMFIGFPGLGGAIGAILVTGLIMEYEERYN